MVYVKEARRIVSHAEAELRTLMKRAIDEQQYGDVAIVATIADALGCLARGTTEPSKVVHKAATNGIGSASSQSARVHRGPSSKKPKTVREYPRFERDDDRLVKIGWSKKDKSTYEHRAPRSVVFAVAAQLANGTTAGRVFTMEQFMPFRDAESQEIPAYQAYLVLKWLQSIGAVDRKGKDGYVAQGRALEQNEVESAWDAMRK